jgi:hypothetical protein
MSRMADIQRQLEKTSSLRVTPVCTENLIRVDIT